MAEEHTAQHLPPWNLVLYWRVLSRHTRFFAYHMASDAIWKKHFCFFRKKLFFMTKKTWPPKKTLKKCFFFVFFYNKLCIKEKRKVVLLLWGPGDPVCPREVKITPPTPSCSPLCGSVCGNWPNWGLLCKLVAKTFFFLCLYDVCC